MNIDLFQINWGEEITKLQNRKQELLNQRVLIDQQISAVDTAIESLIFLGNPHSKLPLDGKITDMGVQDAVRAVFRRSFPMSLTPPELKSILVTAGLFRPNLLVEIHTAITRMKDDLEEDRKGGKKAYRWKMPKKGQSDLSSK